LTRNATLTPPAVEAARNLRNAFAARRLLPPPRLTVPGADADLGYAIQVENVATWTAEGRRLVGRKVGLTNKSVQTALGIDSPAAGVLFDDTLHASGAVLPLSGLRHARAEAEIALVLERAILSPRATYLDVLSAVGYALPAMEIVDCRIDGWNIQAFDFIADNAAARAVVLGDSPLDIRHHDLARIEMTMLLNGELCSTGSGADCLGSPLRSLHWLACEMARQRRPLQAGEVFMTGALGAIIDIKGPSRFETRIGDRAPVRVEFS